MPNAYAKLLLTVNGGATQTGGIQVNPGDVVHIAGENPGYWDHGQYEIYDWPPGWTAPGGWTLQTGSFGQKYVFVSIGGTTPPDITVPVNTGGVWGKWLLRLVVNDGLRNGVVDLTLTDESTAFETLSPHLLRGTAAREAAQFDTVRAWAGEVDANWKRLETVVAGLSGGGGSTPTGTGFVHVTGSIMDGAARAVDLGTADITGTLPIAHGGTGLTGVGAANSVLTSTGTALAFASSLILAGLTISGLGGGGVQMVVADNSGVLGVQAIPGGGGGGTLAGDVVGPEATNLVYKISGNAGAVEVSGGAWTIDEGISWSMVQAARTSDAAISALSWESQSAFATATTNVVGGNINVTLGSNKGALATPWLNPVVPVFSVNYRDRTAGLNAIYTVEPTRFFNAAGIGAGMYLNGANSWLDIGASPPTDIGHLGFDSAVDMIATRNNAGSADLAVLSSSNLDYLFVGGDASFGHQFVITLVQASSRVDLVVGATSLFHLTSTLATYAVPIELTASGPQIQNGAGAPTSTPPNGSFYLRNDGAANTTAYVRAAGAWSALSTGGGGGAPGGSTNTVQYNAGGGTFGGAAEFTYSSSTLSVSATGSLAFGAAPSTFATGSPALRFSKVSTWATGRNNAGSADLVGFATDASDNFWVGGSATKANQVATVNLQAVSGVGVYISTTQYFLVTSSLVTCAPPLQVGSGTFASSGFVRFANAVVAMAARNAGNSADITLAATDASNNAYYGTSSTNTNQAVNAILAGSTSVKTNVGSSTLLTVTATTTTFAGSAFAFGGSVITQGATTAATGDFRVKNAWTLVGRNVGASADITVLSLDSSDIINLGVSGSSNGGHSLYTTGSSQITAGTWGVSYYAGAQQLRMDANLNGLASNASTNAYMFITAGATGWNDFGGGSGCLRIDPGSTAPTAASTSGGVLVYCQSGALKAIGASGTITTMAAADPHCPKCGADFVHEVLNPKYGHMALCYPCLARTLHKHGIDRGEFMFIDDLKAAA